MAKEHVETFEEVKEEDFISAKASHEAILQIQETLKEMQGTLADHEKRIAECSIRR